MSVTLAVDIMGGDYAPNVPLKGIASFLKKNPKDKVNLYGEEKALKILDAMAALDRKRCAFFPTEERILNETTPREALRGLRRSSMRLAIESVKKGESQGVVSAGNTGAYMALSKVLFKTLPCIDRPAIVSTMPTQKGFSVMLDLGANVDATPEHLVQFAQMGQAFSRHVLNVKKPSVGLLNIGTEDLKGHEYLKKAREFLESPQYIEHFYGFIEGNDILTGTTDVVVCDGFTGNIALKTAEGTARFFANVLREEMGKSFMAKLGYIFAQSALKRMRKRLDPRLYNGAPFLGLCGVAVKSHGGTDALGFESALKVAKDMVSSRLLEKIAQDVQGSQKS